MEHSSAATGEESSPSSPKNRLKFLCSFGGRILPRPPDGLLKYVGGETRVLTAPRPLSFSVLRERIAAVCDSDVVVKYQLAPEDLDALVTIKSDEDVRHMVEEYDRLEAARSSSSSSPTSSSSATCGPLFRIYLFQVASGVRLDRVNSMDHRYLNAVNGIHLSPRKSHNNGGATVFTIASPESSPGSANGEIAASDLGGISSNRLLAMHKAHSSPNLQQMAADGGGGQRLHQQRRHQYLHHGSPQTAHYGGPLTRMGNGGTGRGGCLHCSVQNSRPLGNRRYGIPSGTHQWSPGSCQAEEFCCTCGSAEGWPGIPHP